MQSYGRVLMKSTSFVLSSPWSVSMCESVCVGEGSLERHFQVTKGSYKIRPLCVCVCVCASANANFTERTMERITHVHYATKNIQPIRPLLRGSLKYYKGWGKNPSISWIVIVELDCQTWKGIMLVNKHVTISWIFTDECAVQWNMEGVCNYSTECLCIV